MEDHLVDAAILDLLAQQPEAYPRQIAARLEPLGIATVEGYAALHRLYVDGRVARLWGRYLPADMVDAIRARWLQRLADGSAERAAAQAHVARWTGRDD